MQAFHFYRGTLGFKKHDFPDYNGRSCKLCFHRRDTSAHKPLKFAIQYSKIIETVWIFFNNRLGMSP